MKRLIVSGILLVLLGVPTASPSQARMNLDFGVKLGLNSTGMFGDAVEENSFPKRGFIGGIFARRGLTPSFSIQAEVLYTQKGTEITVENIPSLIDTLDVKLDYIEVPILFRYDFAVPMKFKPHLLAGPALTFNVSARGSTDDGGSFYPDEFDIPNTGSLDFGLVLGTGVDFPLGKGAVGIDARYTLGMLNVFEDMKSEGTNSDSEEIPFVDDEGKGLDLGNGGFSFMISYAF
ncbi:MAG: PorT family protein [candidate division Zixibacteria bacterium]|nr:PorT family protein [candidate division Zixibacteria bacterium]